MPTTPPSSLQRTCSHLRFLYCLFHWLSRTPSQGTTLYWLYEIQMKYRNCNLCCLLHTNHTNTLVPIPGVISVCPTAVKSCFRRSGYDCMASAIPNDEDPPSADRIQLWISEWGVAVTEPSLRQSYRATGSAKVACWNHNHKHLYGLSTYHLNILFSSSTTNVALLEGCTFVMLPRVPHT